MLAQHASLTFVAKVVRMCARDAFHIVPVCGFRTDTSVAFGAVDAICRTSLASFARAVVVLILRALCASLAIKKRLRSGTIFAIMNV